MEKIEKQKRRKFELTHAIFNILAMGGLTIVNLAEALLMPGSGYRGARTKNDLRILFKHSEKREQAVFDIMARIKEQNNIRRRIQKLQQQGLVQKKKSIKEWIYALTIKGKQFYEQRIKKKEILPQINYELRPSKYQTIVIFDIPEKEAGKRKWIRSALRNLNFIMLQKSVWIGNGALPVEFIKDLQKMNMMSYIKIFSVHLPGMIIAEEEEV